MSTDQHATDEYTAVIGECRASVNAMMTTFGLPEMDEAAFDRVISEPLEDVKGAFAVWRGQSPNGRKTIFTNGPVGWIDGGPIDDDKCPRCGSDNIETGGFGADQVLHCTDCDYVA
jgi:hypothetical protein